MSGFVPRWAVRAALIALAAWGVGVVRADEPSEIPPDDRCAACHKELGNEMVDVDLFFATDIHARSGLSCVDCHGGNSGSEDPDAAMDPAAGFRGAPEHGDIPEFCGRCHSDPEYMRRYKPGLPVDQLQLYKTSLHGQRLLEGDENVATCVSCHGVHNTRPTSEPKSPTHPRNLAETCGHCHSNHELMSSYGLPSDQVESYYGSVHWHAIKEGGDLSAPTCNDCHGNHGALPPEVQSISDVCGQCHVQNRTFFARGPKKKIFDENGFPECETCHGNHDVKHFTDAAVGLGEGAVCAECHDNDGSAISESIKGMAGDIRSLADTLALADASVHAAEQKGMYLRDAEFRWRDGRQKLYESRTLLHLFDPSSLSEKTGEGLAIAREVEKSARQAMTDYRFRRKGLLIATLIITALALLLYLKIRSIERN